MKKTAGNAIVVCLCLTLVSILFPSCGGKENPEQPSSDFNISGIVLPSTIEVEVGQPVELAVKGGHGPVATDVVVLEGASRWEITSLTIKASSFSFTLPEKLSSGDYILHVKRGETVKKVGKTRIVIRSGESVDPKGATVYGIVSCGGKGLKDVVVSDGVLVTKTDKDGIYRLNSTKPHGYVFMSVPSGYEPLTTKNILPTFHVTLTEMADIPERADFSLLEAGSQDTYTVMMLGDIHLARRTNDREQFSAFVEDVNAKAREIGGKVYGISLGDMTWDFYWQVNNYGYTEYLEDAKNISFPIYHTIGNHDHSMYEIGDVNTVKEYKRVIAPTYYSFNIGAVHYVVLDDVECTNSTPGKDDKGNACYKRTYNANLVQRQLDWLEKDLAEVPASTPLVVTMHIPLYKADGKYRMDNASHASKLESILSKYSQVQLYTAHTHTIYNVDNSADNHIFEHNAGAICATWWWSAYETPGVHIGQDGSPGGYTVLSVSGDQIKWQYKGTGSASDVQFRTYDRNQIQITGEKYVPNGNKSDFTPGFWSTASSSNEVYINIWNWDPSWSISVKENGQSLSWTKVSAYDPLHLIAYTAKRLNKNKEAGFATTKNAHMFKVVASSPNTTLDIKVTDGFGNTYTETMSRPRPFNENTYTTNQ